MAPLQVFPALLYDVLGPSSLENRAAWQVILSINPFPSRLFENIIISKPLQIRAADVDSWWADMTQTLLPFSSDLWHTATCWRRVIL